MSTCSRRGFTVAEELGTSLNNIVKLTMFLSGVAYELVPVDFGKGEHKSAEYREKYQPFGQIPVLLDGDYQVFESRAIARYIADAHGKPDNTLYPKDPKKRALVEQWISVEQSHFNCVDQIVGQLFFAPMFGGQPNQQIVSHLFSPIFSMISHVTDLKTGGRERRQVQDHPGHLGQTLVHQKVLCGRGIHFG